MPHLMKDNIWKKIKSNGCWNIWQQIGACKDIKDVPKFMCWVCGGERCGNGTFLGIWINYCNMLHICVKHLFHYVNMVLLCKFYAHIPFAKYIIVIFSLIFLPISNVNLHITNEIKKNGEEWCTYACCNKCLHNIHYYFLTCLTWIFFLNEKLIGI